MDDYCNRRPLCPMPKGCRTLDSRIDILLGVEASPCQHHPRVGVGGIDLYLLVSYVEELPTDHDPTRVDTNILKNTRSVAILVEPDEEPSLLLGLVGRLACCHHRSRMSWSR